jgi:hypothetical protein
MGIRRLKTASISTGSKSSKFWDQSTSLNSYESISTTTVGSGGTSVIDFTSIPATYKHLQLRLICRDTGAYAERSLFIEYNGNSPTGSNAFHALFGNGSTVTVQAQTSQGRYASLIPIPAASTNANVFSAQIIDILDYANTNKTKVTKILSGYDANGSGAIGIESYLYNSTSAISSIRLYPNNSFPQYSQIALYGIKGA